MVDWKRVTADPKLCDDYSIAVYNWFSALVDQMEDPDNISAV